MQVNEALHAKYVEDTLPKYLMAALVTECKEDYDTIISGLNNQSSGQRIKASVLIVQDAKCNPIHRPHSEENMKTYRRQLGVTGYLDEVRSGKCLAQLLYGAVIDNLFECLLCSL